MCCGLGGGGRKCGAYFFFRWKLCRCKSTWKWLVRIKIFAVSCFPCARRVCFFRSISFGRDIARYFFCVVRLMWGSVRCCCKWFFRIKWVFWEIFDGFLNLFFCERGNTWIFFLNSFPLMLLILISVWRFWMMIVSSKLLWFWIWSELN